MMVPSVRKALQRLNKKVQHTRKLLAPLTNMFWTIKKVVLMIEIMVPRTVSLPPRPAPIPSLATWIHIGDGYTFYNIKINPSDFYCPTPSGTIRKNSIAWVFLLQKYINFISTWTLWDELFNGVIYVEILLKTREKQILEIVPFYIRSVPGFIVPLKRTITFWYTTYVERRTDGEKLKVLTTIFPFFNTALINVNYIFR